MKNKKTKQIILDKSWELFSKNSFFSISMQEIANYIDIRKSLIYYYFESKTKLYHDVIKNYFENLYKEFEIIYRKDLNPLEKIDLIAELYSKEIEREGMISFINTNDQKMDKEIIKIINNAQKNILKYFEKIISDGIKEGDFRNINPKNSSMAIVGYIEKNKQHNNKLEKNWFDFLLKKE